MKQLTNHQTKEKNQIRCINGESITEKPETSIPIKPMISRSNIFLVQNIGKDPPGRWHSPGLGYCQNPDILTTAYPSNKILFINEFQIFKQIQNPNFINN